MPKIDEATKQQRLERICLLLTRNARGISEAEILFPYGSAVFASRAGQLAGNHFATVVEGVESLARIGAQILWEGAQEIVVELEGR